MDDQLGAEDLRRMQKRSWVPRSLGGLLVAAVVLAGAYYAGYLNGDTQPPQQTRIINRYVLPRPCLRSIAEASNAMDAISNLVTAQGVGASADAQDFAAQYHDAHEGFVRDLVACEREHGIPSRRGSEAPR